MIERERLIKLLDELIAIKESSFSPDKPLTTDALADYLLSNGVIVSPCKVGDVVYQTDGVRIYEAVVRNIIYDTNVIAFDNKAIGKSVFLTYEEAEAVMVKRQVKKYELCKNQNN